MDSLRYWVEVCHVDGFRFDLATTLARGRNGFDRGAAFFAAVKQDPVLADVKMIAEPLDIGPGGYQVGAFPSGWSAPGRRASRCSWLRDNSLHQRTNPVTSTAKATAGIVVPTTMRFMSAGRRS